MAFEWNTEPTEKDQTTLGFSVEFDFSSPGDQDCVVYYGVWNSGSPPADEATLMAGTGAVVGTFASPTLAPDTLHTVVSGDVLSISHTYKYHVLVINPDL